ncbi:MAG: HIT domain-containing protein [Candidatus Andersenbacteria bacterium]
MSDRDPGCIFCKIATGELHDKTRFAYEDELVAVFADLHPIAPVHLLLVPKKHYSDLNGLTQADEPVYGRIVRVASTLAKKFAIDRTGWQLFVRVGKGGGQEVGHVHFHLISGKRA